MLPGRKPRMGTFPEVDHYPGNAKLLGHPFLAQIKVLIYRILE